ncbi:MAG: hypothetical protein RIR70_1955 [Pseudomonadota bacterium]|jgi:SM-20-related protein
MLTLHDDLLPPALTEELAAALAWVPMYFLRRIERNPAAHPLDTFWYYPLAVCDDPYTGDVEPQLTQLDAWAAPVVSTWTLIRNHLAAAGAPVRLYETEIAANSYGSEGHPHFDIPRPEWRPGHLAAIVYGNREWDLAWGGETLIFDEHEEVAHAVRPRPGRVAIIKGDPYHVARGVSRLCPEARRVLVFKMWLENFRP